MSTVVSTRTSNACRRLRNFSTSSSTLASTTKQRHRYRDPYAAAQAKARKAANISRQEALRKERAASAGDPVRGLTTRFVQSFDAPQPVKEQVISGSDKSVRALESHSENQGNGGYYNHGVKARELERQLAKSKGLFHPIPAPRGEEETQEEFNERKLQQVLDHEETHKSATEAINRILHLDHGNAKDRLKVNIQKCIQTFGRHVTDDILPRKAPAVPVGTSSEQSLEPPKPKAERAGPDTGSSEVQIAILTAKIRALANFVETRGRKDKVGKRDLRLLVHRRQKLLKYLHRKERGGPRWQRCIKRLGLTEGTWKGEITL